jgi:DNA polymerase sigma
MGDIFEDIIEENLLILRQNIKLKEKDKEEKDLDCLIKKSLNIYCFLREMNSNLLKKAKIDKESLNNLNESLDYLEENSFYYSKGFLEQFYVILNSIYFQIINSNFKKNKYEIIKKLEKNKLLMIPIDKTKILLKILDSVKNPKLLVFYIKNFFHQTKFFSLGQIKKIYMIIAKMIKYVYKCKIISKKNYFTLLNKLLDSKLKPKPRLIRVNKSLVINYSRFFKKKNLSNSVGVIYASKQEKIEKNICKVIKSDNYQNHFKNFYQNLYEEESLYYKVKFHKPKKHLERRFYISSQGSATMNQEVSIKETKDLKSTSNSGSISSKDVTKNVNNYNKYDNSENTSVLFHLSIPLKNYMITNINNDKCDDLYHQYINLKLLEMRNPELIMSNMSDFETKILLPLYQKIIFNSQKKKPLFYYAFAKYRNLLKTLISKETEIPFNIEPYGSYSNNFLLDAGDIDICIIPNCEDYLKGFSNILEKVHDYLVSNRIAQSQAFLTNKRYLLLKIVDKETNFNIDITVHSLLPVLNTKLIRLYSLFDQRFHILGIYLKYWSKLNKVQGTSNFFLSSYALTIMLIYFLQNIAEPKVLPNLQKIDEKEYCYEFRYMEKLMRINIYFNEDLLKAREHLLRINNNVENVESVTILLVKFFEFFSYYFDSLRMKISISKEMDETFKELNDNYAFSIEDPFDPNHNPGKSMYMNSLTYETFLKSMKLEINYILNGEYLRRMESTQKMDNN